MQRKRFTRIILAQIITKKSIKTLVIHPKDPTTDFLKPIYSNIIDKTVITGGVTKKRLNN